MRHAQSEVNCKETRPRGRLLVHDERLVATLRYYDAASGQEAHAHQATQISFLLLGSLSEAHSRRAFEAHGGWFGIKPAGCRHSNGFGPEGALILTIETKESLEATGARAGWAVSRDGGAVPELARLALDGGGGALSLDAIHDMISIAAAPALAFPRSAPSELQRAFQRLHEEPEQCRIDALARNAGFERTHFTHLFRRHFGTPPSVYRAKRMTAKATGALLSGRSPTIADAAFAAGFADHSHYTKTLRRFTGFTPLQLRAAFG
jgi:AraC family transcriptional regulator